MSKFDKLVERFKRKPKDFTFSELKTLLSGFGYSELSKGKTSGSRVGFISQKNHILLLHKPHPKPILKAYVMAYVLDELRKEHLL